MHLSTYLIYQSVKCSNAPNKGKWLQPCIWFCLYLYWSGLCPKSTNCDNSYTTTAKPKTNCLSGSQNESRTKCDSDSGTWRGKRRQRWHVQWNAIFSAAIYQQKAASLCVCTTPNQCVCVYFGLVCLGNHVIITWNFGINVNLRFAHEHERK